MSKKRYSVTLVLLGMFAGFFGGAMASQVLVFQSAFAEKKSNSNEVIQAQEFRLVNRSGKTEARLTVRDGKLLAEIPDLNKWTIQLLEGPKER
jgi:hypothetical protein